MKYNSKAAWTDALLPAISSTSPDSFPAQGLIRILRGAYPELPKLPVRGAAIDVGCGDGRNAAFLQECGFDTTGYEITPEVVAALRTQRPELTFKEAACHDLPLPDACIDVTVSWHACYYMSLHRDPWRRHLQELIRVTRTGGAVILSIPMPSSFIFAEAERVMPRDTSERGIHYYRIGQDPFGVRIGEILAVPEDQEALYEAIRPFVEGDIAIGTETGSWFGLQYDWWDVVAIK